jgi:hypothetical protein
MDEQQSQAEQGDRDMITDKHSSRHAHRTYLCQSDTRPTFAALARSQSQVHPFDSYHLHQGWQYVDDRDVRCRYE